MYIDGGIDGSLPTQTAVRYIYILIPCRDCQQHYIGETFKKVEIRLTEHRNAIKRHDPTSPSRKPCRRL